MLFSTFNILKDALRVVMEGQLLTQRSTADSALCTRRDCFELIFFAPSGTPKNIDYEEVKADLNSVDGVRQAHSLHIWSLTLNKTALSAHLVLGQQNYTPMPLSYIRMAQCRT